MPESNKNTVSNSELHGEKIHIGDIHYHDGQGGTRAIPTLLTNLIPTQADHVVGRHAEIKAIQDSLKSGRCVALVNGIGGMGKTTVARKFMVEHGREYQHRAWLNASSGVREAFLGNLELLQALQIRADVEKLVTEQRATEAFGLILKTLKDLKSTLVVLDNANNLADLLEYKKHFESEHCHFLITSRAKPQGWPVVPLDALPEADAIQLFQNIHPADEDTLLTLVHQLFRHPLLVELVAKSARTNALDFDKLKKLIAEKFIHDQDLNKRKVDVSDHSDQTGDDIKRASIEEYIWLIFKNVQELPDTAREMLRAFSLLPTATVFDEDGLAAYFKIFGLTDDFYDTLDIQLAEKGWLDRDDSAGKPGYKMYPLIADVVIKHLEVTVGYADEYIKQVAILIDYDNTNPAHDLLEKEKGRPLAERLVRLFFEENTANVSFLLGRLGNLNEEFGLYQKAIRYKKRALKIAELIFEQGHVTITALQNNLGNTYSILGQYDRAVELLKAALASSIKTFGKNHPRVATNQSNLGVMYSELGQFEYSVALLEAALASDIKNFGQEHPNVASVQSNLGDVYRNLGQYDRAVELLEAALASELMNFGKSHPNVARVQSNLGIVFGKLNQFSKAEELLEAALKNCIKNFGTTHPNVASCQYNLAYIYQGTNRPDEALTLWHSAYEIMLGAVGSEHPLTKQYKKSAGL